MPLARDLLHPEPAKERQRHKLKRLVQHPNSYFMDVKCPGCYKITTVFSHAQSVVVCVGCNTVLCQPTGGKAKLVEGCSFRKKAHWDCCFFILWRRYIIENFKNCFVFVSIKVICLKKMGLGKFLKSKIAQIDKWPKLENVQIGRLPKKKGWQPDFFGQFSHLGNFRFGELS